MGFLENFSVRNGIQKDLIPKKFMKLLNRIPINADNYYYIVKQKLFKWSIK